MKSPDGRTPAPNPRYLPATWGCMLLVFVVLLILFVADILRRAGFWQLTFE
jgi:uncharacterized membrane protein